MQGLQPGVEAAGNGAMGATTTAAGASDNPFAGYLQAAMPSSAMAPGWMTRGGAPLSASTTVAPPMSTEEKKGP